MKLLNLGCDRYKLPNFINIDINPNVEPDLCFDILNIHEHFEPQSIDFIFAGHVFEHFTIEHALTLAKRCFNILKPYCVMLVVVPDLLKCAGFTLEHYDRIILAGGAHKVVFDKDRISKVLLQAGFKSVAEIDKLNQVPYILVSNINDPQPDPWQTAVIALKI